MKTRKGCWTCADRRIQCDGGLPTCNRCARAHRECQGYEMRLSWPRDDDKRRAIVAKDVLPVVMPAGQSSHTSSNHFINTTWHDITIHRYLSLRVQPYHLVVSSPGLRRQPQQHGSHMDLVHYYLSRLTLSPVYNSAHRSLVTFGESSAQIRDALMSMALAHETDSGLALFHALLAFSALHRYGLNEQAVQLKIQALRSLASITDEPHISAKAAQHVAASMLLGAFENAPSPNPTYAIMSLLSEICDTLVDPRDPRSRNKEYQDRLKALDSRVENVLVGSASAGSTHDAIFAVELYQTATRIYLARASQSPWEQPPMLDSLIDAAFAGPVKSCTCEHFFPLFILACEARRDEQRVAIINLVERTQRDARIRSIQQVKDVIQSIWVQQDLNSDNEVLVNYSCLLSGVISSRSTVPSFV
ncbi:hypothetical protein ACJZ2D_014747 [Fusarium nematophilum]